MIGGTIMAHPSNSPDALEAGAQPPSSAGYVLLPRQLRQDCRQVGINTLKLVLFVADATLGWEFTRWAALTYRVLVAEAGIPNDAGVRRAIEEAQARSLVEVQTASAGTLYAIHRRYWRRAGIQPKWHLYKRVPYDSQTDPLDENLSAITMIAEQNKPSEQESQLAITMIAQPLETPSSANGSTITMIASNYHHDSDPLSSGEQAAITMIAQPLATDAPGLVSHDPKELEKEGDKEIRKEGAEEVSDEPAMQDIDALQQRQVSQHALQKLLAEREQLRAVLPSQRGWGAAQGRLRSIAREIEHYQALTALPGPAATGKAESTQGRITPAQSPQASATPALSEHVTRGLRLTTLQEELAQLKRTPSMQLLARRRIPLLEAEIKQLIAEMPAG
jgi:hypothetical protein